MLCLSQNMICLRVSSLCLDCISFVMTELKEKGKEPRLSKFNNKLGEKYVELNSYSIVG